VRYHQRFSHSHARRLHLEIELVRGVVHAAALAIRNGGLLVASLDFLERDP
jgi:hypothetical protein